MNVNRRNPVRRARKGHNKFLKRSKRGLKKLNKNINTIARSNGIKLLFLILLSALIGFGLAFFVSHEISNNKQVNTRELTEKSIESPNATSTAGPAQNNANFSLYPSWSQDFAGNASGSLNKNYWEVNLGPAQNGNNEKEYYTDSPTNLHIKNGALSLEAVQQAEPQNYDYSSARIDTDNRVAFLYGRIDITAKLPDGVGTWPAAWFLPANNKYEDLSPASDSTRYLNGGEIDLIEEVGFQPNVEYGIVHTLADLSNPNQVGSYNTVTVVNNNNEYNKYSLLWTPTTITFEVNDQPFYAYTKSDNSSYTTWPFDQPFYLILNLAVGGQWGGEDTAQFPNGIDNSALPASMDISSINYYPYLYGQKPANNIVTKRPNPVATKPEAPVFKKLKINKIPTVLLKS